MNRQFIDQSWSINRIVTETYPISWESVFEDAKRELNIISNELDQKERTQGMYYPLKSDIFNAFYDTPLNKVDVVILGQDPYPQTVNINGVTLPRAVGLSFSVRRGDSIPSSLQNIYTELGNTVPGFIKPHHGDLSSWTSQGVLLLNRCLTVQPDQSDSHDDLWGRFIDKIFRAIAMANPQCVYMLWGQRAQKMEKIIRSFGGQSVILKTSHPSGLSVRKGFFGSNHFNLANEALIQQGRTPINWNSLSSSIPSTQLITSSKSIIIPQPILRPITAPKPIQMIIPPISNPIPISTPITMPKPTTPKFTPVPMTIPIPITTPKSTTPKFTPVPMTIPITTPKAIITPTFIPVPKPTTPVFTPVPMIVTVPKPVTIPVTNPTTPKLVPVLMPNRVLIPVPKSMPK
jgi:uracil-DNA glycosylase